MGHFRKNRKQARISSTVKRDESVMDYLRVYLNMLQTSIEYGHYGGPPMNGDEGESRGTPENPERSIPTTNQEHLAFIFQCI
jgi:hypothetical protein